MAKAKARAAVYSSDEYEDMSKFQRRKRAGAGAGPHENYQFDRNKMDFETEAEFWDYAQ